MRRPLTSPRNSKKRSTPCVQQKPLWPRKFKTYNSSWQRLSVLLPQTKGHWKSHSSWSVSRKRWE
ncbi:unnamed protein product [Cladocopium goreaui]|uniref:Uncharacterized protein n=1 Tax=Cladocopium goreaui TaxID=2562237 RepID=A0A9P1BTF1_9DINO|nr:unnamed protein product [Cladocopium goreaui]